MPTDQRTRRSYKYTYGPVPSRRLGYSLGIDIIPHKNCSFDCIYCQLGKTSNKTIVRRYYTPAEEIISDVKASLALSTRTDYLTFSGSGEPTLHKGIGYLINELKKITKIPVAVLTNGSLLYMPDVRKDLENADIVLPTLCTVDQGVFRKIHRSHRGLDLRKIIEGYVKFRRFFTGKIWLELMVIKGMNDKPEQIEDLKRVLARINPDKIHLNTVVRPPSESFAHPVSRETMEQIKKLLGEKCEIIADFKPDKVKTQRKECIEVIAATIARRPVTMDDLMRVTGLSEDKILEYLHILMHKGSIQISKQGQKKYYTMTRGSDD